MVVLCARLEERGELAAFLDAWERAKSRVEAEREEETTAKQLRVPRTLPAREHVELRKAYEAIFGNITDEEFPAPYLLEVLFDQVQDRYLTKMPITAMVSLAHLTQ